MKRKTRKITINNTISTSATTERPVFSQNYTTNTSDDFYLFIYLFLGLCFVDNI